MSSWDSHLLCGRYTRGAVVRSRCPTGRTVVARCRESICNFVNILMIRDMGDHDIPYVIDVPAHRVRKQRALQSSYVKRAGCALTGKA